MSSEQPKCELCGEPMPPGEEMFKIHGLSGNCPKPPLPRPLRIHRIMDHLLTDIELERAFDNVDVDIHCGACMEIFFTDSSPHQHSCNVGQGELSHPWKGK